MVISWPEPLGSQGELIVYASSQRRPSSVRRPPFLKILSSETAWPIKAKFYLDPPWEGGTKVYINRQGIMTKSVAMLIYGKTLKIFFSATSLPMILKLGILHWRLKLYKSNINDDPGLTLTYFTARSNLVTGFSIEKK